LVAGKVRSRKLLFSLIVTAICIALVCGTVTAITYMSTPQENPQPTSTPTATPQIAINQPAPLPTGCITSDEALSIAKSYVTSYASNENRAITNTTIQFYPAFRLCPDNDASSGPAWIVSVWFNSTPNQGSSLSYGYGGVVGFSVGIWAETGEVFCHEENAVC
jgi:hypothetical protein